MLKQIQMRKHHKLNQIQMTKNQLYHLIILKTVIKTSEFFIYQNKIDVFFIFI